VYINGGYLFIDAGGDGLDTNGSFAMTDGVVLVNGPTMAKKPSQLPAVKNPT
jgi:hypothetical protein